MIASILQIEPSHFGFRGTSRRDLIDCHSAEIAEMLYNSDDKLMLICDGTYARHQKSSNNECQRKSFSGQNFQKNICYYFEFEHDTEKMVGVQKVIPIKIFFQKLKKKFLPPFYKRNGLLNFFQNLFSTLYNIYFSQDRLSCCREN